MVLVWSLLCVGGEGGGGGALGGGRVGCGRCWGGRGRSPGFTKGVFSCLSRGMGGVRGGVGCGWGGGLVCLVVRGRGGVGVAELIGAVARRPAVRIVSESRGVGRSWLGVGGG